MLLDLEANSGNGSFMPELEEPEHCNAGSTSLWELHALTRHYHPLVERFARHILMKSPTSGNGALSMEITRKYVFVTCLLAMALVISWHCAKQEFLFNNLILLNVDRRKICTVNMTRLWWRLNLPCRRLPAHR